MARRRVRKTAKEPASSSAHGADDNVPQIEEKEKRLPLIYQEVERQIAAIRAIRDVEIEHSLIGLRLLQSYLSEEQLQGPAIQFFKENLHISVAKRCENEQFEVQLNNDKDDNVSMNQAPAPSLGGLGFASNSARTSLIGGYDLQGMEVPFDCQMLVDGFQTPGANSQRMSVGMTPKTVRLPKPGEMLVSVHGSPLGVYNNNNITNMNMDAIQESEEG